MERMAILESQHTLDYQIFRLVQSRILLVNQSVMNRFLYAFLPSATEEDHQFLIDTFSERPYVQIGPAFFVACYASFKDSLADALRERDLDFTLVYVNLKAGNDVLAHGLEGATLDQLKSITTP